MTTSTQIKMVPVTERALAQRIKRALAKEGTMLKQCREDSKWFNELGSYYGVSETNGIAMTHIDLQALAKEMNLMKPWEVLG